MCLRVVKGVCERGCVGDVMRRRRKCDRGCWGLFANVLIRLD